MTPMNDVPGGDAGAMRCFSKQDESLRFRTYLFMAYLYKVIFSARPYISNLKG